MKSKSLERKKAIKLRKKGLTYSEILKEVRVAKSTLSRWLKDVKLAKPQKQRITKKRKRARLKGVKTVKRKRIKRTEELIKKGEKRINKLSKEELFILGTALYWAEGTKQKSNNISQRVCFNNSDPEMIKVFLKWLLEFCSCNYSELKFEIYIHKNTPSSVTKKIKKYWKDKLKIPKKQIVKVRYKNSILKSKSNLKDYYGVFRITVAKSTDLNRLITGWIKGIVESINFGEWCNG